MRDNSDLLHSHCKLVDSKIVDLAGKISLIAIVPEMIYSPAPSTSLKKAVVGGRSGVRCIRREQQAIFVELEAAFEEHHPCMGRTAAWQRSRYHNRTNRRAATVASIFPALKWTARPPVFASVSQIT